jgi:hypothetical protein
MIRKGSILDPRIERLAQQHSLCPLTLVLLKVRRVVLVCTPPLKPPRLNASALAWIICEAQRGAPVKPWQPAKKTVAALPGKLAPPVLILAELFQSVSGALGRRPGRHAVLRGAAQKAKAHPGQPPNCSPAAVLASPRAAAIYI